MLKKIKEILNLTTSVNQNIIKAKAPTLSHRVVKKSVSQTHRDIADWKHAERMANRATDPTFYSLQNLYNEIAKDGLLSSQVNNRHEQTVSADYEIINANDKRDDKLTALLNSIDIVQDIIKAMLDSELYGYSLIELGVEKGKPTMINVPRQNLDPINGRFYPDYHLNQYIEYRETKEYNKWLLEFYSEDIGLLNKTVPHVLFKKFAQSCWSELCEIYGIPPRYIKTNTQDEDMLQRAEVMLKDMGASASFVIDSTEEFQFAQGVATTGDVYNNLIKLCNNEISLLITGAILGQDTQHGNYSKEEIAISILDRLINADKRLIERYMNAIVLPAFCAIGWLPKTKMFFKYSAENDNDRVWRLVKDIIPYKDVNNKWLEEKFGIPVEDKKFAESLSLDVENKEDLNFFV